MTAIHGGRIWHASRELGAPCASVLDFSANINPYGPPQAVLSAIITAIGETRHYPDPEATLLVTELARHHRVLPETIVPTNGGAEAIILLPPALGLRGGVCCSPVFSEYREALATWGREVIQVPERFVPGRRFEDAVIQALQHVGPGTALFVCNPNNPTGELADPAFLLSVYGSVARLGGTLVVDESFIDFTAKPHDLSLVREAALHRGLVVIRSMTKFYSIPGLRLGYTVATPETCTYLKRLLPPWSVNHLAQVAGLAALTDPGFPETRTLVTANREELRRLIDNTGVLTALPSAANFLLLKIGGPKDSIDLSEEMKRKRVLIRDCSSFYGLGTEYVRVAVRLPDENRRLVLALAETMEDR